MSLHAQAREVLVGFDHFDPAQQRLANDFLSFLDEQPNGVFRECRPGHITASALVMDDQGDNVLLTLHPKVGRWLQLGGHLEPTDGSVLQAAVREVAEESGIIGGLIGERPLRLDRHPVPCGRDAAGNPAASEHLDVQFLVVVPEVLPPVMSEESDDLRWFGRAELPTLDDSVRSLIADAAGFLRTPAEARPWSLVSFG